MNLPKDWQTWYSDAGLVPESWEEERFATNFQGFGFPWRVDCRSISVGECDKTFDRWANSQIAEATMPKTKAKFDRVVQRLLLIAQNYEPEAEKEKHEKPRFVRRMR